MTPARWIAVGALGALTVLALYLGTAIAIATALDDTPPAPHLEVLPGGGGWP